jgi:hypothetical protein
LTGFKTFKRVKSPGDLDPWVHILLETSSNRSSGRGVTEEQIGVPLLRDLKRENFKVKY